VIRRLLVAATLTLLAVAATPACNAAAGSAGGCGTVDTASCGLGADQGSGQFHGLLAVRGVPWVLDLAAQSGTRSGCADCSWKLVLACEANGPGSPSGPQACTAAGMSATCQTGQRLYRVFLSTDAVLDAIVGEVCIGGPQQPVPVGTDAKAAVERYLKDVTPPDLDISTSPPGATLAGLTTTFTATPPATLRPVTFGGGELTETITVVPRRADWRWGDGSRSGWLDAAASLAHAYERGGVARLTMRTRWGATYTIGYQGETFGPYDATGQIVTTQGFALPVYTSAPTLVSR
jgi:hypothetical protein